MNSKSLFSILLACMLIAAVVLAASPLSSSGDLPPGVTIQKVTASGKWMCNVINGKQGECAIISFEFYNVGQLVDGYGDAKVSCVWEERGTPLDVTGKYFTGGPQGKIYFDYAGYSVYGQLVNGEYITFESEMANDIPIDNPSAFDGFSNLGLEVAVSSPQIVPGCALGTGLRYTITAKGTGFPTPEVTVTGDDRIEDMGDGIYEIEFCSTEQVELEITSKSGDYEQTEYLFLPREAAPAVSLAVIDGPTLVPALSSSGDVYRYEVQATVYGYPAPELSWTNATPAAEGDTTVTVTVPAGYWLWQFPTVSATATNAVGSNTDSIKLPVESLVENSGAGFSDISGQVMICFPDKDPGDENNWVMLDERTMLTMNIPRGTRIRTGADSEAVLGFSDMASYVLKPESTIVIHKPPEQQGKISLVAGNIWANIKSMVKDGSMDIEMNQAVAGIKGTIFECIETGDVSTLIVYEGEVEFTSRASGETVMVSSGEKVTATSAGLGQVTTHSGSPAATQPPATAPPGDDLDDIGADDSGMAPSNGGTSSSSTPIPSNVPPPASGGSESSFPLAYAAIALVLVVAIALVGLVMKTKK